MRAGRLLLLSLLLVLAAACGGDDNDAGDGGSDGSEHEDATGDGGTDDGDEADAGEASASSDTWSGELESGAPITARLWVEPTGDGIEQWEELRQMLGAPEYQLVEVTVDNTGSDEQETGRFLTFVVGDDPLDQENVTESTFACSAATMWQGDTAVDAEEMQAINDAYNSVLEDLCDGQTAQVLVPPGEEVTYWVVVEGSSPPQFDTIYAGIANELRREMQPA
jgi:hypothetical protein